MKLVFFLILVTPIFFAFTCEKSDHSSDSVFTIELNKTRLTKHLSHIAKYPHPFGSNRQLDVRDYIISETNQNFYTVNFQKFIAKTPNPTYSQGSILISKTKDKVGYNIIALPKKVTSDCLYLIGSHYDSKHVPGKKIIGANDSGSSSAALIELSHEVPEAISTMKLKCAIGFIWFDGEESILSNWQDGERGPWRVKDNTYGSRFFVNNLQKNKNGLFLNKPNSGNVKISSFLLFDMIGGRDIKLSIDLNSTPSLVNLAIKAAKKLGNHQIFSTKPKKIEDDHIPFVNARIPSLNVIGFEHLDTWHTEKDSIETISLNSINTSVNIGLLTILLFDRHN